VIEFVHFLFEAKARSTIIVVSTPIGVVHVSAAAAHGGAFWHRKLAIIAHQE
jgi:hypothetical protein